MTEKEKISKQDALTNIRQRIKGCFGDQDKIFAGHSSDEKFAKELGKIALQNDITRAEMIEIVWGYLHKCGCHKDHIEEQIKRAEIFFGMLP
jgi:hypothetical protein